MEDDACVCVCVLLHGSVWRAGKRNTSLIHPAKAIYTRITLPEQVRQEHCCTSNYLIREAASLCGGRGGGEVKVEKGESRDTDWVKPQGLPMCPDTLITAAIST